MPLRGGGRRETSLGDVVPDARGYFGRARRKRLAGAHIREHVTGRAGPPCAPRSILHKMLYLIPEFPQISRTCDRIRGIEVF